MSKRYYSLLARDNKAAPWTIEFGDYDRSVVTQEMSDRKDSADKGQQFRVITTGAHQRDIQAAVDALNMARK